MTPKQVILHFGTIAEASRKTDFTRAAFHKWVKQGYIPLNSQWQMRQMGIPLKINKPYAKEDVKK